MLIFSQLPNEYVVSFIPKNTNKTKKRSHFLGEIAIVIGEITIAIAIGAISISEIAIAIAIGAISIGEIAIAISPISIVIDASREIGEIAIDADRRDRDRAKRRSRS